MKNLLGFYPGNLKVYRLAFSHRSSAEEHPSGLKLSNERLEYLGDAVLSALVADYLQYRLGYLATNAVRDKAEAAAAKEAEYSYTDVRYRVRGWCFWLKQVLAIAAVVWLGLKIGRSLL